MSLIATAKKTKPKTKPKVEVEVENVQHSYVCSCCKKEFNSQMGNFYCTISSMYRGNNNYLTICISCITAKFKEIELQMESARYALIAICHLTDSYYSEKIFNNMVSQNTFTIGAYLKSFNGRQWGGKTFTSNLLSNDFAKTIESDDTNIPVKETISDIKNRSYCLSQIGYDPFADNIPADRVFLFNTLSEYLTDDIIEDPHKMQSVISLVKSILQETKFDKLIDAEQKSKTPNTQLIRAYIESKETIRKLINSTAKDNGVSLGSGKSNRGANTLTGIMREMAENDFEEIKVNVTNIKMDDTYKNITSISNKSIFEQLNFQSDDYARMVATQREVLQKYEEDKIKAEEELRLAKMEIKKLKSKNGNDG